MNSDFVSGIRSNLESRSTEELCSIFEEHDDDQWTNEAFTAIESILTSRGVAIPSIKTRQPENGDEKAQRKSCCPKCYSTVVKLHGGWFSVLGAFVLFLAGALLNYFVARDSIGLSVFLSIATVFAFAAIFAAAFSALLGKNKCKKCGHTWR